MEQLKVAVIGLGNRGRKYTYHLSKDSRVKIVALCEKNTKILEWGAKKYNVKDTFSSDEEFFKKGKLADVLLVTTQDRDHYYHAKSGLNLGYELLLEKPVSPSKDECEEINRISAEKGLRVVVCHVLRYASFYDSMKKVINSGAIGDIVTVNDTENIGYWHFSHSYVRGNWRKESESGPSILAKCCHDFDMIYYLTGKKCQSVYSTGSRKLFKPEMAPEGATKYCLDPCPNRKTCPFFVGKIYYSFTRYTIPLLYVNKTLITGNKRASRKEFIETLKTSPYGRCVYFSDNDVMENQNVALKLEDGVSANLTMTAFSKYCFRRYHISGTKGEIIGSDKDGKFRVNIFGGKCQTVKVQGGGILSHLGGDAGIVRDFVDYIINNEKTEKVSTIDVTLESHRIAFAAEESRKSGKEVSIGN